MNEPFNRDQAWARAHCYEAAAEALEDAFTEDDEEFSEVAAVRAHLVELGRKYRLAMVSMDAAKQ